jgi:hypothetical protein
MKHFMYLQLVVVAALTAISLVVPGAATAERVMHPDDRAVHSPTAIKAGQSKGLAPDDRVKHHPSTLTTISPVTAHETIATDFEWIDAGIGAATAFGLVLLAAGGFVIAIRQRRSGAVS